MFKISNVEFSLLALIHEKGKITGYQLNTIIEERGYREWAGIGTTSIYTGLKKLKQKGYVKASTDRYKKGKGPKGVNYMMSPDGLLLLKTETQQGLSKTREGDKRFHLAILGLDVLSFEQILNALSQREEYLKRELTRIKGEYKSGKNRLPLSTQILFCYKLNLIDNEITCIEEIINTIKMRKKNL